MKKLTLKGVLIAFYIKYIKRFLAHFFYKVKVIRELRY